MNYNDTNNFGGTGFDSTDVAAPAKSAGPFALLSMIFGIVGIPCGPVFSILAIIFAIVCKKNGENSGSVMAGLITGIIGIALYAITIIGLIVFYAIYFIALFSMM